MKVIIDKRQTGKTTKAIEYIMSNANIGDMGYVFGKTKSLAHGISARFDEILGYSGVFKPYSIPIAATFPGADFQNTWLYFDECPWVNVFEFLNSRYHSINPDKVIIVNSYEFPNVPEGMTFYNTTVV